VESSTSIFFTWGLYTQIIVKKWLYTWYLIPVYECLLCQFQNTMLNWDHLRYTEVIPHMLLKQNHLGHEVAMFYIVLNRNHSGHVEVILYVLQNGYHFGHLQIMFYLLCNWNYLRHMEVMLYILHNWSHKTLLCNNLHVTELKSFRTCRHNTI